MFFAGAWGYFHLLTMPARPGEPSALPAGGGSLLGSGTTVAALAALIGTAVLAGLLGVVRRVSPLATALPGALLLAWTVLYLVSVRRAAELIPLRAHAFGAGWEALLFNGVLGVAAVLLIIPALLPSRWREPRTAGARPQAGTHAADQRADERLAAVWPDARPRQAEAGPPEFRQPEFRQPEFRQPEFRQPEFSPSEFGQPDPAAGRPAGPLDGWQPEERPRAEEPALTGTVLKYPASGVRPVDTTRVTGASRALRATGSFAAVPGAVPRKTGSFAAPADGGLLGRPYYRSPDE